MEFFRQMFQCRRKVDDEEIDPFKFFPDELILIYLYGPDEESQGALGKIMEIAVMKRRTPEINSALEYITTCRALDRKSVKNSKG